VELSIWALFSQAGFVVKIIMIVLVMASVWSWAIIFEKIVLIQFIRKSINQFESQFWSGMSLNELFESSMAKASVLTEKKKKIRTFIEPLNPIMNVFVSAMREWKRAVSIKDNPLTSVGLQARLDRVMAVCIDRDMEHIERRMTFLASTGSVAPFVGLFGTVWGIMGAFQNIGMTHNTSLSVVAPGIAEALLATAFGLVAAIPAVLAYNKLASDFNRIARRLEGFSNELSTILSRQMDIVRGATHHHHDEGDSK